MTTSEESFSNPKRAEQFGVKIPLAGTGNLVLASGFTLTLLFGMVLVLSLALIFILENPNPTQGLIISVGITIAFNVLAFFFSPYLMDLTQKWLYDTHWVSLVDIDARSPETAAVIQRVCQERNLKQPRLGIINDQNPTAFTYGSLPNQARLVVSEGLFTYLNDEEIATVYAHELGHIVHWDFAVMTLASTLVQITYLIYVFTRRLQRGGEQVKNMAASISFAAYVFYIVGTYFLLYLSRTREYFADHFAAETTGNPNALSRALVKIAYGILEESEKAKEPSRLLEGTRALGIYDAKAATSCGTAYRITSNSSQIGRVFLWDLFNPWAWWMQLNSTHPLTGKRVRALSTYAEKLGLDIEFDMGRIVGESRNLNRKRLYGNFIFELCLYMAELIGIVVGVIVGFLMVEVHPVILIAAPLMGFGLGHLIKTLVIYPNFKNAPETDILTLMSDPYASPLRGKPAQLQGQLIGRGQAGYTFGSDLKLQDSSGMIYLRYNSRFGALGNFLFGMKRVKSLIGMSVQNVGWFRRGVAPWMDLVQLTSENGTVVNSYHRFWSFVMSISAIAIAIFMLLV
ncbi:MAG: zinc metalloprotease HtpX [Cyanobacteria bacterium J06592_8]